jgi:large subunit ribosomal protein L29|uniref:Large ribosomal subunit protein uL29c n=1 Tax=Pseudopedinella elastica TaxID=35684 RepID=A0A516ZAJ0_9STRA|nr:ribosomal protein L29 [Pseudopedinella elastica]QDR24724.1 ribosomal protein L29 [Pseudopedinella elastica]|tara:strand:- start:300 stop:494 length:195 start_codon:yes stop_codon:yes gene_type:complete
MAFLKNEQLASEDLEKKILETSQLLVELRLKKVTRQAFKPHEFKHAKRLLAQLLTLQNSQNKVN